MENIKYTFKYKESEAVFDPSFFDVQGDGDIDDRMRRLPGVMSFWFGVLAEYKRVQSMMNEGMDLWMATEKHKLESANVGKYKSEKAKEEAVIVASTEEYMKKRKEVIDIAYYVDLLENSVCKCIIARKDTLMSMANDRRQELKNGMQISA